MRVVHLKGNNIEKDGFEYIADAMQKNTTVTSIDLRNNPSYAQSKRIRHYLSTNFYKNINNHIINQK